MNEIEAKNLKVGDTFHPYTGTEWAHPYTATYVSPVQNGRVLIRYTVAGMKCEMTSMALSTLVIV